ncbi:hypothetical protein [Nocardia yamanashiensis]|uniref:hypothetical protein n=1 Tax=Nocardia yamanashiensis TaxID=209247 RepID=UPI000834080C|nr:hypothetical protein [Nocardia yamanashiensis]
MSVDERSRTITCTGLEVQSGVMADESDECQVTVTGAPSVVATLRHAARITASNGHNWFGKEDLLAALLADDVSTEVPGPTPPGVGPAAPATVSYELSGPHAEEFRRMLERS